MEINKVIFQEIQITLEHAQRYLQKVVNDNLLQDCVVKPQFALQRVEKLIAKLGNAGVQCLCGHDILAHLDTTSQCSECACEMMHTDDKGQQERPRTT